VITLNWGCRTGWVIWYLFMVHYNTSMVML